MFSTNTMVTSSFTSTHKLISNTRNTTTTTNNNNNNNSSSTFLQFSEPFFTDDDLFLSELVSSHQQLPPLPPPQPVPSSTRKGTRSSVHHHLKDQKGTNDMAAAKQAAVMPRRTGKKDRHSKIYTKQGPRDRRMRLSLQIARKFFDLQDMLGFDKASQTIEWLFTKSMAAIEELTDSVSKANKTSHSGGGVSICSNSESEVVSGSNQKQNAMVVKAKKCKKQQNAFNTVVAKECREKARARARERTREKNMEINNKLGFENSTSVSQVDSFVGIENYGTKSTSIFDFNQDGVNFENDLLGFQGNWNLYKGGMPIMEDHVIHVENPSVSLMATPIHQEEQNSSSIFISDQLEGNPSSLFHMNMANSLIEQNNHGSSLIDIMDSSLELDSHDFSGIYQLPTSSTTSCFESIF